jgi:putative endonuclease
LHLKGFYIYFTERKIAIIGKTAMALHNKFGQEGEKAAVNFVIEKGYRILEINYRLHPLEVDIIAMDGERVVFIEVKTRQTDEYGHPIEFITGKKEQNLIKVADYYLQYKTPGKEGRFDVITLFKQEGNFILEHFIDAFNAIG